MCLSIIYLSNHLSISSFYQSTCVSINHLSVKPSVYYSISLSISIYQFIYVLINLSIQLSFHSSLSNQSMYHSIRSIQPSIYLLITYINPCITQSGLFNHPFIHLYQSMYHSIRSIQPSIYPPISIHVLINPVYSSTN